MNATIEAFVNEFNTAADEALESKSFDAIRTMMSVCERMDNEIEYLRGFTWVSPAVIELNANIKYYKFAQRWDERETTQANMTHLINDAKSDMAKYVQFYASQKGQNVTR